MKIIENLVFSWIDISFLKRVWDGHRVILILKYATVVGMPLKILKLLHVFITVYDFPFTIRWFITF